MWKSIFFPSNPIGFISPCETSKCIRWSTSHPIAFTCSFSTILEKNDQSEDFALWENLSFSTRSGSRSAWGFGFIKLGFWSNSKYQICPSSFITYLPFALYKYITIIITNWPPVASVPKSSTSCVFYSPTCLGVKGVSKLNPQPVIFNQIITLSSTFQTQVLGFERLSRLASSYSKCPAKVPTSNKIHCKADSCPREGLVSELQGKLLTYEGTLHRFHCINCEYRVYDRYFWPVSEPNTLVLPSS